MTYSNADGGEKSFLLHSLEEFESFLSKINDEMMKVTLRHGVGYLYEGLSSFDHEVVT